MKRVVIGVVLAVVVVLGFGVWWFLIRDDAPPEAAVTEREVSGDTSSADGGWEIVEDEDGFAGFRITEHFTGGIDNTAVVRTAAVDGTLTVDGSSIDGVTVEADLTQLDSKDSVPPGIPSIGNRIDQMRDDGLELDTFPTATFTLTSPIDLGAEPAIGASVTVDAPGELTIHGVTQQVTIPIEARWTGDVIDVAGTLEVVLADYGMNAPERPFVSVDEVGTMEFQLVFERSA